MRNVAIIAEYNPFHNGHRYQFSCLKQLKADTITVCMSGNFVQRAEPAIMEKHRRAETAILCGADLVVELPFRYSISSAEDFAFGGISLIDSLKYVDTLCFGSENGDINNLLEIVNNIENADKLGYISEFIKTGVSYPKAIHLSLERLGIKYKIEKPNDILAVEYIKNLKKLNSNIKPYTIKRIGDYHSNQSIGDILSASAIRNRIKKGKDFDKYIPIEAMKIIKEEKDNFTNIENIERIILAKLRLLALEKDKIKNNLYNMGEGLENRILKYAGSNSLIELYKNAKTKRYPMSSIRRAVLTLFFEQEKDDIISPPYIHVLAFNNKGRKLLRELRDLTIPVFHTLPSLSDGNMVKFIKEECMATDIFNLAGKKIGNSGQEFTLGSVYVNV